VRQRRRAAMTRWRPSGSPSIGARGDGWRRPGAAPSGDDSMRRWPTAAARAAVAQGWRQCKGSEGAALGQKLKWGVEALWAQRGENRW
jgi:hypothetical protein